MRAFFWSKFKFLTLAFLLLWLLVWVWAGGHQLELDPYSTDWARNGR